MRFFQAMSFSEIGEAMESSEEAARKRVSRALQQVRRFFMKKGFVPSIGGLTVVLAAHQTRAMVANASFASTGLTSSPAVKVAGLVQRVTARMERARLTMISGPVFAGLVLIGVGIAAIFSVNGSMTAMAQNSAVQKTLPAEALKQSVGVGHLHLTFAERSPFSKLDVFYGRSAFSSFKVTLHESDYNIASESFEAYVPASYRSDVPYGLLVWVSPGGAAIPPAWTSVFDRHKLIFISPNNLFTEQSKMPYVRQGVTLDAAYNMAKLYNIDASRVYIGGFSGGGLVASQLIHGFPDVFRGVLCVNGEDFYFLLPGDAPSAWGIWDWQGSIEDVKRTNHIVLMTGDRDRIFEPEITRGNFESLQLDNFQHLTLLEIPGGGHAYPPIGWFERGVMALDDPKPRATPTTAPTTDAHPEAGQIAEARRLVGTAEDILRQIGSQPKMMAPVRRGLQKIARRFLRQAVKDYPTTPSAARARELLVEIDRPTSNRSKAK
jgi:pimeloyl-ACP methyl ester carboxylesterase